MKGLGRNKKNDLVVVNVVGHLSNIMLGKVLNPKYAYIGSLVMTMNIKSVSISETLIDLGETINVMNKDMMLKVNIQALLIHTTIVLQLEDSSIVFPKGMLEDIIVCVDSLEYPTDFIVLRRKISSVVIPFF